MVILLRPVKQNRLFTLKLECDKNKEIKKTIPFNQRIHRRIIRVYRIVGIMLLVFTIFSPSKFLKPLSPLILLSLTLPTPINPQGHGKSKEFAQQQRVDVGAWKVHESSLHDTGKCFNRIKYKRNRQNFSKANFLWASCTKTKSLTSSARAELELLRLLLRKFNAAVVYKHQFGA